MGIQQKFLLFPQKIFFNFTPSPNSLKVENLVDLPSTLEVQKETSPVPWQAELCPRHCPRKLNGLSMSPIASML